MSEVRSLCEFATVSPRYEVLGVEIDAVQIPDVIDRIESWITCKSLGHFIAVTAMHGIVEAQHDASFRRILGDAALVVPDGMPLVWLGRTRGYPMKRRVYGPELTVTFCRETRAKYRHFFYGGAPGVAEGIAKTLQTRYGIQIAGTYSPPFGPLSAEEERQVVNLIRSVSPDVVWVGLGTPLQEKWMHEHHDVLGVPVLIGIGAAFDFITGRVKQAPRWMQEHGLECFFRLWQEPKRLWRRYFVVGSEFVWCALLELVGLRIYPKGQR
jgi:N-acetylglucosaminyldiphosphoundecaprenol N-acetyl-beta-D-mannosaminyltransferase